MLKIDHLRAYNRFFKIVRSMETIHTINSVSIPLKHQISILKVVMCILSNHNMNAVLTLMQWLSIGNAFL